MSFNLETFHQYFTWLFNLTLTSLPRIIIALIILIIGWFAARVIKRTVKKLLFKTRLDKAVSMFLTQIIHVLLIVLVVLIAINQLGISTTPITAALAGIFIGISMSLRSSMNVVTAGIMIISSRPFKIGEFVDISGTSGTVESINFVYCSLRTSDGREVKVPNSYIISRVITNFTNNEFRRNDFVIGIGYDSDIEKAKAILQKIISQSEAILQIDGKAPVIRVDTLADSSVNLLVRYWTKRADFMETKWRLTEQVKLEFDKDSIEIPYPQRQIHNSKA